MPKQDDLEPPSLGELEAHIGSMPDGQKRAALLKQLAGLRHAFAIHDVLTKEIAEQAEGEGNA